MAVYVDTMRARVGRMIMCHMLADTTAELHAMADRIGVDRRWCQHAGTYREHYDVSLERRTRAIAAGAEVVSRRQLAELLARKKAAARSP